MLDQVIACLHQRIPPAEFVGRLGSDATSYESQEAMLLVLEEIAKHNAFYVKTFLKPYMRLIERSGEVADGMYELCCDERVLGAVDDATLVDVVRYPVGGFGTTGPTICIKEQPRLILGQGTTGLRTWEAALFLANYLGNYNLCGKTVCELGAGTGLVSLAILKTQAQVNVVLTDGDASLIHNLHDTFVLNGIAPARSQQLLWGTTTRGSPDFIQPVPHADIVVAADVTYDTSILPQLVATIGDFLACGTERVIIAATVRNAETTHAFERLLAPYSWSIEHMCEDPHAIGTPYFRAGTAPIKVYTIQTGGAE